MLSYSYIPSGKRRLHDGENSVLVETRHEETKTLMNSLVLAMMRASAPGRVP